jgi:hypothetical protein
MLMNPIAVLPLSFGRAKLLVFAAIVPMSLAVPVGLAAAETAIQHGTWTAQVAA